MTHILPYGSWPSPISAALLTAQNVRLSEPQACAKEVFWLESRPAEKGRNALVRMDADGRRSDVLPEPHSFRTRAHEYGGGSYLVTPDFIICVLDADQRVYRLDRRSGELTPLTPANPTAQTQFRFADFCWDKARQRIIAVREDHRSREPFERSEIVAIDLKSPHQVEVLVSGADFYSSPRLDSNGKRLSYICWNHPQMPWDGSECHCAELTAAGEIASSQLIAGGPSESIVQPQWSPDDQLFFVSDRNNWWNIYRFDFANSSSAIICDSAAEFATPQWLFGMSCYGFLSAHEIYCCFTQQGQWYLGTIDIEQKKLHRINCHFKDISSIHCHQQTAYFLAACATQSAALYRAHQQKIELIAQPSQHGLSEQDISQPQPLNFPTSDGESAFGFYYPAKNSHFQAPEGSLPPLIVMCHGGPTGATETSLNLKIQFWTSRGFSLLDINYRGSTGYGRKYRDRLKNNWGITDVIDVCSGADYLIAHHLVDKNKIAIRGSSAGGYTVLAALTFSDTFKAGASLYGIGDLEALARDTHKFEAHYLDSLVGQYPAECATYRARSPIHHVERLNCPVIFLQGLKDKVVPPQQAEAMVQALHRKGIRADYVTFAEEGHGFRQAENIQLAITAELEFYQSIFNGES